ncbi:lipopolysaccharide biosynthesis protein [uncultured Acetobacteroides sp.]|uniref:lipopolysaccharide biosynthesis protein n=1 Tax=uncultured Acetobacteroides sp. TaxID=1760811 RepID=UPI0029F57E90|nr:lipopolysaccharide biosynthesis protein [uncultured Acetobacteroides sp.]
MADSLKEKTINGLFWSSLERFSIQGIQFVIGIILARLLTPSDFGIIGMLSIFLAISQSFIDSGFSNALIRKIDRTQTDYSTVFYFNIIVGLVFYSILFFTAPLIALFYNTPILIPITRFIAITLLLNSLTVVQRAHLSAFVDFKTQAKASVIAVIISGSVGVWMAYNSYGVWSLVLQYVLNVFINSLLLWFFTKWRPSLVFSTKSFVELFSYGSRLLVSGLLDTIYRNVYTIVIGKRFAAQELGFYTRADQFAQFPSSNISGIVGRVTFPILSGIQHDDERLRIVYRKYLKLSAFVVFPLMIGLAAVARPLILLLLNSEWESVIPLLQILCFSMMWYPVHSINLNLLQVKGRSDLFLRLEIIKKIIAVLILIVTIPIGVIAMCWGIVVSSVLALVVNTYYTGKVIKLGFFIQMRDLMPLLLISIIIGGVMFLSTQLFSSNIIKLSVGVVIGISCYITISLLFKSKELSHVFSMLQ